MAVRRGAVYFLSQLLTIAVRVSIAAHELLLLHILSNTARQLGDGFDVVRLREHVEGGEGVECVAAAVERAQVACEGGGVAGDVGNFLRVEREDASDRLRVRARAGR